MDDEKPAGVPGWIVTYGDMMSLLLTFFIMLVSISERKTEGQLRAMLDAIRSAFGATDGIVGAPGPSAATTSAYNQRSSHGARSEGGMERAGRESEGLAGPQRTVRRLNHGTVSALGAPIPFERFSDALTERAQRDLNIVSRLLARNSHRVVVRGHASREPLPPDSPHRDKMDLSFARARAVADYLASRGIDRIRLRVGAAGDSEPRVSTRDRESQRQNDRVDVFAIDSYIPPAPPTSAKPR